MKTLDITLKDLKHIFLSIFSLVMMFGAPLLITGLLYFAFGSMASGKGGFTLPVTKVQVANLDQPGPQSGAAGGQMLVDFLKDKSLVEIISVTLAPDEASARKAVDEQRAGVAIIIPPDFSAAAFTPDRTAAITLYQDPTLTIGPGIVKDLVSHYMDAFSGAKIAGQVAGGADQAAQVQIIQKYTAWLQSNGHGEGQATPRLSITSPTGAAQSPSQSPGVGIIGPIMAGMLVLFVFFMGANGAESIITEDEQGTLSRLFTTPTSLSTILGGKFLGVVVCLCIQVLILLLVSIVLFGIKWGQPVTVLLVALGLIVAAAGFGVMLMSFIKNSRQTGAVLGGTTALLGMLGGLFTTGVPRLSESMEKVTLVTPHGWALKGLKLALSGADPAQVLVPVLVLLAMGLVFFAVGLTLFRRRFA